MKEYEISIEEHIVLENWFYNPPKGCQPERYKLLNDKTRECVELILKNCPPSRERSLAITKLQEARMWANGSIACNE